jgi:hypothetical protein
MSGYTGTLDSNGSLSVAPPLLGSADYLVTKDSATPNGETPVVTITAGGVAGTLEIDVTNGAVANVTENVGAATSFVFHADGGTVNLNATDIGAVAATDLLIENGGTATLGSSFIAVLDSSTISFGPGTGNVLNLSSSAGFLSISLGANPIAGFAAGDAVIDNNVDFANVASYAIAGTGDQTVTFFNAAGTALDALTFSPDTFAGEDGTYARNAGPIDMSAAAPTGAVEFAEVCFAAGTHILTPFGEVTVESLQIGDLVLSPDGIAHPVTWLGHRHVNVNAMARPADHHLVRIKAEAFGPDVPHRDLLITQEHCIFADGGLIPARMLVNERSIILDHDVLDYTYYHVELATHNLLIAEGLATESYLDTGNRGNFANSKTVSITPSTSQNVSHQSWADAIFPLTVDAFKVEPVWRRLNQRAVARGVAKTGPDKLLTNDPALRVLTGSGAELWPVRAAGDRLVFILPASETELYILSRAARPSEVIGPFVDDRRELGVLVGEIIVYDGGRKNIIDRHMRTATLAGWFDAEDALHRWTNGKAHIPLDLAGMRSREVALEIQITASGPYFLKSDADLISSAA